MEEFVVVGDLDNGKIETIPSRDFTPNRPRSIWIYFTSSGRSAGGVQDRLLPEPVGIGDFTPTDIVDIGLSGIHHRIRVAIADIYGIKVSVKSAALSWGHIYGNLVSIDAVPTDFTVFAEEGEALEDAITSIIGSIIEFENCESYTTIERETKEKK
jgi:hypothetical protein